MMSISGLFYIIGGQVLLGIREKLIQRQLVLAAQSTAEAGEGRLLFRGRHVDVAAAGHEILVGLDRPALW